MKTVHWFALLGLVFSFVLVLALSCGDDDSSSEASAKEDDDDDDNDDVGDDDDDDDYKVEDVSDSGCKTNEEKYGEYPESIEFDYSDGILTVIHRNGVINCCYESITVMVSVNGFVIDVHEQEITPEPCDCVCPVDVTTEISGLAAGTYTVNIHVNGVFILDDEVTIP